MDGPLGRLTIDIKGAGFGISNVRKFGKNKAKIENFQQYLNGFQCTLVFICIIKMCWNSGV